MTVADRVRRGASVAVGWLMLVFLAGIAVLALARVRVPLGGILGGLRLGAIAVPTLVTVAMVLAVVLTFLAARRWPRAAVLVSLLAVVAVRLAVALAYEAPQVSDWHTFELLAAGLRNGQPPFADRAMGWPVLLAVAWSAFGESVRTGVLLNVALAGLTGVALAAWLRMLGGNVVAAVGVMAFAVFPSHVLWVLLLGTEVSYTLSIMVLVLAITWLLWPGRTHSRRVMLLGLFGVGLLLGASYWIRSTSLLLVPLFAVLPLLFARVRRESLLGAGLVLAGVALALAPIVAWNASALGRVSVSNSLYTGWQLYIGNNERSSGSYNARDQAYLTSLGARGIAPAFAAGSPVQDGERTLAAVDDMLFRAGLDRLAGHGAGVVPFAFHKLNRAWGDGTPAAWFAFSPTATVSSRKLLIAELSVPGDLAWVLVLGGALVWFWRRRRDPGLTGLAVGGVTLLVAAGLLLLEAQPRYHEYVVPLLLGLASVTWVESGYAALERVRGRTRQVGPVPESEPSPDGGAPAGA